MARLGADTEGLTSVGVEFRTAGALAAESGAAVVNTCNASVDAILAEMERAERTCMDAIQSMADGNRNAASLLDGIEYEGQNAVVARQTSGELQQRCLQAQADMQATFGDARASVTALGDSVTTIATEYNNYAVQVAESEDVMAQNMDTQRANLEAAMNGVGG